MWTPALSSSQLLYQITEHTHHNLERIAIPISAVSLNYPSIIFQNSRNCYVTSPDPRTPFQVRRCQKRKQHSLTLIVVDCQTTSHLLQPWEVMTETIQPASPDQLQNLICPHLWDCSQARWWVKRKRMRMRGGKEGNALTGKKGKGRTAPGRWTWRWKGIAGTCPTTGRRGRGEFGLSSGWAGLVQVCFQFAACTVGQHGECEALIFKWLGMCECIVPTSLRNFQVTMPK